MNLAKNILSKVFQIIQLTETFDTKRFCWRRNFLQNSQYSKHNKKNFGSFLLFWRLRHLILNVFVRELIFQKSYVFDEGENINFLSRLYQFGGKRPKQFFSKFWVDSDTWHTTQTTKRKFSPKNPWVLKNTIKYVFWNNSSIWWKTREKRLFAGPLYFWI